MSTRLGKSKDTMRKDNGKSKKNSVLSPDSDELFEEWMESRPRPRVTISDEEILFQTLKTVGASPLRDTLTKICSQIPSARKLAIEELLIYKDRLLSEELRESGTTDAEEYRANGIRPEDFEGGGREIEWRYEQALIDKPWWKQKCARYETCARCGEEYELEHGDIGHCDYHPGNRRVDKNSWVWDKEAFNKNPKSWDELQKTSPAFAKEMGWDIGFRWDCCNELANKYYKFCKRGKHIPTRSTTEEIIQKHSAEDSQTAGKPPAENPLAKKKTTSKIQQKAPQKLPTTKQKPANSALLKNRQANKQSNEKKPATKRKLPGKENEHLQNQEIEQQSDEVKRGSRRIAEKRQRESEDTSRKVRSRLN